MASQQEMDQVDSKSNNLERLWPKITCYIEFNNITEVIYE